MAVGYLNERTQKVINMVLKRSDALSMLGMTGVDVVFGSLAEASAGVADLFVVSAELADTLTGLPVLGLDDLLDADQAAGRLEAWLKESEY